VAEPIDLSFVQSGGRTGGRRRAITIDSTRGRHVRSGPWEENEQAHVDVAATMRATAARLANEAPDARRRVETEDLRRKLRVRPERPLVVLVVDSSESMQAQSRMTSARNAALGLIAQTYLTRDRVAMIAFGGDEARVVLEPTASMTLARERLHAMEPAGATPLASGLYKAWELVRCERLRDPSSHACIVLLSDGEANVPIVSGARVEPELAATARLIRKDGIGTLVIDTNPGDGSSRLLSRLRGWLGSG